MSHSVGVEPGCIVIYSDIACPWAHLAVHRIHVAREGLGLAGTIHFQHRAFPLEMVNSRPTPKRVLESEIPVVAALDPEAGWRTWRRPEWEYVVTSVPALAAVQACTEQGPPAAEQLDRALRAAMFVESRCISVRSVILEVAAKCDAVDVERLAGEFDSGRGHAAVARQWREGQRHGVIGSPHLFTAAGDDAFNPGVTTSPVDVPHEHFVHVESDDPSVYANLLERAAAVARIHG